MRSAAFLLCLALCLMTVPGTAQGIRGADANDFDTARLDTIEPLVQQEIAAKKLPGAVILVGRGDRIVWQRVIGNRALEPSVEAMTADTIFDAASLTKVVATTTAAMILIEEGRIRLSDRVATYIPGFERYGKASITVRHLMTHMSGLRPDVDLGDMWTGYDKAIELAIEEVPVAPPGTRFVYSDIGYFVLADIIRRVSGQTLDAFTRDRIFTPLGMHDTLFKPPASLLPRIAPTELCTRYGWPCDGENQVMLRGIVHDPTARRMDGVSGHAGLFTTARDLSIFARMLLNGGIHDGVPLRIALGVGGIAQTVDVTAVTPVIDTKRTTTSTNVTLEELQGIPSSRDPWVVFQTVPGIIVDRVNVGGAESGQQSNYQAKGASGGENTWNIDGIPITDMAATGASPTYYDFDMFSEMQVTTGGADVQNATPGVHLNMVLKSGTNTPHGSSRVFFSNEDMQSNNLSADLAEKIGGVSKKGNRTDQYADYGGEIGGPILKDRLWAWGSYGKTDVRVRTLTDVLDRTILENIGFKTTAQIGTNFRPSFTYFYGDKIKNGRGASATRPDETTWNQAGPTAIYKGETSFVLSNNLFLTARGAYSDMGFTLTPRGGLDKDTYRDDGGVWHNSYYLYGSNRPQKTVLADGNYFRGRHELKFGFSWRNAVVESYFQWPGSKVATIHIGYPTMLPIVTRDWVANTEGNYLSGYIGDTMTWDRLTLNVGARIDTATSSVTEAVAGGSPVLPNVLPGITGPAVKNAFDYTNVTPRLGATFALDESRKTLLRGSYSMFSSQLSAAEAEFVSSIQFSGIYYLAVDQNGNNTTEVNEILFSQGNLGYYGFDPADPASTTSVNRIGDPKSPRTHEALFGVDRELFRNFGVSATFTYRRFNNTRWNPLIGVTRADYRETGVLEGNVDPVGQFSQPYYALDKAKVPPGGGRIAENRPGYHQRFLGFEMSATKRMSNRWMARLGFSTNDHREYFTDPARSIQDPTPGPSSALQDGGVVVRQSGGSGKAGIYMILPKYQFIANGLVQGPWGFNFGANLVTRQGFGTPWFRSNVVTGDPLSNRKSVLAVKDLDERRLPAVTSLDVRLEKAFRVSRANIIFDLDVFNATNTDTVLGRQYDMRLTGARGFNNVLEIMNPRILRLGLRLNF